MDNRIHELYDLHIITDFKSKAVWLQKHYVIRLNTYVKWKPKLFL